MEQFGKYELIRRIGSGGMAEVFLARTAVAQNLAKHLVIKKIHPAFARSRQFVSMFVDEAKIALGLNHPNIVQVFDFGQIGDTYFLAMEYVEGVDVLRLMQEAAKQEKRIPLGVCAFVVQEVAKGLDYAHRKVDDFGEPLGIVHRDISPQNVLVSWDGAVKIVDFGIARARNVHEEEGVVKGKFAYMSPEQARGEMVDRRADVFSLGVVLFELSCGRPMFPGKGKEVLDKVKSGVVPLPREVNKDIPAALEQIILQAVAFHREDRFQTGRDLQNALGRFQYELASGPDGIVDSGDLAKFVAQTVPERQRRATVRPPTAPVPPEVLAAARAAFPGIPPAPPAAPAPPDTADRVAAAIASIHKKEPLRERKHVFVLQGKVCGLKSLERRVGIERAARVVAEFLSMAQDIAFKHDAHVDSVEHGRFTLAVGLPVASEDDAARTFRLAMALVEALDGIGHDVEPELRLAVGIQRGIALVTRKEGGAFDYELGAQTTGIARAIAAEAQGADILCGGAVYRVARRDWNFEELATIDIPDVDAQPDDQEGRERKRATVYRLRGPKERAQRLRERSRVPSVLGRDLELKALRDAYRDVRVNDTMRAVAVFGEAGMGKRSVVGALLSSIPEGEAVIVRTAGRASATYTPFGIIADLARDLLGLAEGADARETLRRLETAAKEIYPDSGDPSDVPGVVEAIGALLGAHAVDGKETDPGERRRRVLDALTRVAARFSGDRPLVAVCEDMQWADEKSLGILGEILGRTDLRGILIIVTSRPDTRVIDIVRQANAELLRLEELGEAERLALIERRFLPGEHISELAEQLVARAGGNPFFLNELLDALVDRGILRAAPGGTEHAGLLRWVRRETAIAVPSSVESLLATRIDQLPGRQKQTLLCAAAVGPQFPAALVEQLSGAPVNEALGQLVEQRLLRAHGQVYSFANELILAVAYRMLPNEERIGLHERAAKALVGAPGYQPGPDGALIARHLELAGRSLEAAERYLAAAAHSMEMGGSSDAFRQLTRALQLLPAEDHARRFDAHRQREEILRRLGQRPQQLRELTALRKEAESVGAPDMLAIAHSRSAQYHIDAGKLDPARKAAAAALECALQANDRLAEAEAYRLQAEIAVMEGAGVRALALSDRALALCGAERDDHVQRAHILLDRGTTLRNMSRLPESIEAYAEALVIYRMLRQPRLEARALNNMGVVFSSMGEIEEALAHYKSSLKLHQRLGDRASFPLQLGNIGQTYARVGDLERAEKYLGKGLSLAEQNADDRSRLDTLIGLAQLEIARGVFDRALEHIELALNLARDSQNRYQEIRAMVLQATALIESRRDPAGALELSVRATTMAREMPMPFGEIMGLAAQGLALAALHRADEGVALTASAVQLQRARQLPEAAEQVLSIHAMVCETAGRTDDARRAVTAAFAEVERKAARLADPRLRETYLASNVPKSITQRYRRLLGAAGTAPGRS